ncbi:MAG: Asp-tRNA(Asn)/Glu-tRNA(Gln) amidotransferase subunit GatB [Myxococcota bacterium]
MGVSATLDEALAKYEPVIGLEVHAQLKTSSKLFSPAPNRFDPEHPNQAVTAYCVGLPGVLPVLNERAVEMAIKAGLALGCTVRERSIWARKQYFYPDLPKGYQLSQFEEPICEGGSLDVPLPDGSARTVGITRIHMEEDAGKSTHVRGSPRSLVDFSRAGVPLIEIVSDPDLRGSAESAQYLRELRAILRALDVCDGNLEQGSFRCDANVSLRPRGTTPLGRRVELKNINSFRFIEQAIDVEILRHARILDEGGTVTQETRLYDADKRQTRSMRSKEEAEDYRYFPDPDLPPLIVARSTIDRLRTELPELPAARRQRWIDVWKVPEDVASTFAEERAVADFYDAAVGELIDLAVPVAHLVKTEVLRELKDDPAGVADAKLDPKDLGALVQAKEKGKISSAQMKKLFAKLWKGEGALEALLEAEGEQVSDPAVLGPMLDTLIRSHPKEAKKLAEGQKKLTGFFVGQVMKQTKGQADPGAVQKLLAEKLVGLARDGAADT